MGVRILWDKYFIGLFCFVLFCPCKFCIIMANGVESGGSRASGGATLYG